MALKKYANGKLFVYNEDGAGGLVAEAVSGTIDFANNATPVITLADGFTGVSPGAGASDVSVESAVPRTGIEFDYLTWSKEYKIIELSAYAGATPIAVKGFITNVGVNIQVGDVKCNFKLIGGDPE